MDNFIQPDIKSQIDEIIGNDFEQKYLFDDHVIPRKSTTYEKELRKELIKKLVIFGVPKRIIIKYMMNRFNLKSRQIQYYLSDIVDEFKLAAIKDMDYNYSVAVERYEDALRECISSKDMKNRIRVLSDISEIQGLKVQKHELTGAEGGPIQTEKRERDYSKLTDSELETLLALDQKMKGVKNDTIGVN